MEMVSHLVELRISWKMQVHEAEITAGGVRMKFQLFREISDVFYNIYHDRRLLCSLAGKDFQRRFSGTYFGAFWAVAQPMLTIIVYWIAFEYGFRSGTTSDVPFVVWFICGIVPWLYIQEAFTMASNSFLEYSYLIKKVKFNFSILVLVKIFSALIMHLVFLGIVVIVAQLFHVAVSVYIVQIVYYLFAAVALLFGLSLITASIMVFFRDLNQIISVILLIGMWGTPIAWDLAIFDPAIHKYFQMNPFYYIIEGYRDAVIGRQWFWEKSGLTVYFWMVTLIVICIGCHVFSKLKSHFADVV